MQVETDLSSRTKPDVGLTQVLNVHLAAVTASEKLTLQTVLQCFSARDS